MGMVKAEHSNHTSATHFRHLHPMEFSNLQTSGIINPCCSVCKLQASGPVYICKPCGFLVHPKCYELPKEIKHESHKDHTLSLQTKPVYPGGLFYCDACGNPGDGFSYHCEPCRFDLHSSCASLPMQVTHRSHKHKLRLTFCVPYALNCFTCDICKMMVSFNTWRYRCATCDFDGHLTCIEPIIPNISTSIQRTTPRSAPQPPTNSTYPPNIGPSEGLSNDQLGINSRTQDTLSFLQGLQQMIDNDNNARMQAMLAGSNTGFGAGVRGNNNTKGFQ